MEKLTTGVEWWAASRALRGERESGDRFLVAVLPTGTLFAVVDGIGHGHGAAAAADVGLRVLREPAAEPLSQLVGLCHEALRDTRGVVASVAHFDDDRHALTWIGVGNVEGVVLRPGTNGARTQARLLTGRGVLGGRL